MRSAIPAVILQHRSAKVILDKPYLDPREQPVMNRHDFPEQTPESVQAAIDATNAARLLVNAQTGLQLPPVEAEPIEMTREQCRRLAGFSALDLLVREHGADRVLRWWRTSVQILGGVPSEFDRPTDRCLAVGAELTVNKTCVQCGRDNS
jgi:hypothetical protein